MKDLLGNEYPAYLASFENPPFRGIRLNTLKCSADVLKASLPFPLEPSPFSPLGYLLPKSAEKIGRLPMHHAGAFYVQEPSAASAVTVLNPQPGEKILDLCAAPGGKSTQIAALLGGKGLLWSNEAVHNRAGILLSNMERMGIRNAIVSCCGPDVLCSRLEGYFDRVLVDAPCSGEGMFRRSEEAIQDWSPEHVKSCAVRQLAILESACTAVKGNGVLVYSTCTFSREENEEVVAKFLTSHSDFKLSDCGTTFGRPAFLPQARRVFPMDGGEGHFVAKLVRHSSVSCSVRERNFTEPKDLKPAQELCSRIFQEKPLQHIEKIQDSFYLVPDGFPCTDGLGVLRVGVQLGTLRPGRAEPAHAVFMASKPEELQKTVALSHDSTAIAAFLHGEEIQVPAEMKGWCGVAVNGVTVGFGKCSDGRLKNHYPKGLRNL